MSEHAASPGGVLDEQLAATAMSFVLGALALVVLDVRVARVDLLSDPVGFALGVVAALRLRRSTIRSRWSLALVVLAPVAVATSLVGEIGAILHGGATGVTATADVPATAPTWVTAAVIGTAVIAPVGVLLLARHLRRVLEGIASDRWRQVTIAWVVTVVLWAAAWVTGALELVVVAAMISLVAAVLLVLSLLATRRLLEDEAPPTRTRDDATP